MRAQVAFEEVRGDRMAIIVTELPYQVNKAALLEKIADLVKDKRIDGISDLRDESDRDGMRIYIEIKRDANPHKVLNNLFKHTPMQLAFNMNMLALVDGQPQTLPLKQRPASTTSTTAARSSGAGPSSTSARRAPGPTSSRASRSPSTTSTRSSRRSASRPTSTTPATNLMTRFDLSELQAQAILDMRLARLAALERKKIEDEYLAVIQLIAELEDILANPARVLSIIKDELDRAEAQVRRRAPDPGRRRRQPRDDRRGPDRRRGRRRHDHRPRLHQAPAGRHVPPPAPRRQGDHRPRHARGGRGRAPARREHPRLGAVLHEPRPRVQRQGPRDPRRQPPGQGHRRSSTCPGVQVEAGEVPVATIVLPDFEPGHYLVMATRRGHHQEDAARAVRAGPLDRHPGDHDRTTTTSSPGSTSRAGEDDVIIATAQGMLARFDEDEVRPMGRDAAGVIGIRLLKREGDSVVAMSVVEPDADLLVLTETGYGKRVGARRVPAQAPRRPGRPADRPRGPQDRPRRRRPAGHRGGRGARPDLAGGQVIRTETNTINRYSPRRPRRDRHAPGRGRPGRRRSRPSGPGWRSATASATMAPPNRAAPVRPVRRGDVSSMTVFGQREAAPLYADQFEIYHGNANPELARKIARYLGTEPGKAEVFQFANENIFVKILDNVREKDVFLVQPTSHPVNQSIMELLIMIDAFKRASAGRITAVIPFYAYGRSDKKDQPRVPITARLIADMITVAGADRVLTMDLHQGQIQGFFNIPVDELTAVHMLSNYFIHKHLDDLVVVTDLGFAKRARAFAELLDAPLAIIEKRRVGNLDRAELMNVIGEVRGKRAIIVDDEIDTAGTLIEIVRALEREGVTEIYACATHGVLSDPAIERIRESSVREVVITDSVPLAAGEAHPEDHDAVGRAAHRRGDQAHPPRRVGRRAVLQRGLVHPGDAPLGRGRRRRAREPATAAAHATTASLQERPWPAARRQASDEPAAPPTRRRGRPRAAPGRRADWRDQLRSPRWGVGLAPQAPARAQEPGDEPDVARSCPCCSGSASAR